MEKILEYNNRKNLYQFLIDEFGVIKVAEKYGKEHFGNFSIVLSSADFLINYVNDRSFLTIEIASISEPAKWYDLSIIWNFLYNPNNLHQPITNLDNTTKIKLLNNFLKKDFNIITKLMNVKNYSNTFIEIDELLRTQFKKKFE